MFRSALNKKRLQLISGFTLIEVLVVIGILGILATVALVAINPAEAQKKARDTQRLKDMSTLQSIIEQYLQDNPGSGNALTGAVSLSSSTGTKVCGAGANWLTVNLCPYANVIPIDPINRPTSVTNSLGAAVPGTNAYYYFVSTSAGYKLCTYMESASNKEKIKAINDGGNNDTNFEVFSSSTITCP
ncbi:MAG: hypothetical protein A3A58_03015 [Candidatus Blackburnbacteria bacterium RIFCSPLOWO2_01_FULL_41_27]|uniref:Type II secretion system protein GspG C-terminal domain-containing protein n=1 Tax=Candidatus Blackburnbacteria bacterium RIFCSPLOWO2_01_FULL_41_27 TaxID=1797520 RepID=A0A1G1VB26_9BACT|nr:MAG: hypothetical protein A3A58_03015 [Candidatus Blackburnbacteria bacterium RIFCSPLOWO2_01_FULL_41_27]